MLQWDGTDNRVKLLIYLQILLWQAMGYFSIRFLIINIFNSSRFVLKISLLSIEKCQINLNSFLNIFKDFKQSLE